jgi:NADPH:quinone reductase-like Zn-dependent oxidoreductase
MEAIVYHEYGPPDVLALEEVDKPSPKEGEILIRVRAVSVNDWDWGLLHGTPFANRLMSAVETQEENTGSDLAGQEVGRVSGFDPAMSVCGLERPLGRSPVRCAREDSLHRCRHDVRGGRHTSAGMLALQVCATAADPGRTES